MKSKSGGKFVIALIIAYLLLPLALTLIYSLFTEWMDILPSGFTLRYYAEIFADPIFWASLARTVVISFIPVFITAVVLLLAMYAVVLYMPALDKYLPTRFRASYFRSVCSRSTRERPRPSRTAS